MGGRGERETTSAETAAGDRRRCVSCRQPAAGHRCANDHGLTPTHPPLAWHDHEYDEWYCQTCADGYGEEFFEDGDMNVVE